MARLAALVADDPGHFEAHHLLGGLMLSAGRGGEAIALLERAVALRPGEAGAQADLGAAYADQGRRADAIAAYQRAVGLAPRLVGAHVALGGLLREASRMAEATACFDRAAAATPDAALARLYRAEAAMLRDDDAEAERWTRQALALAPDSAVAHATLAGLLYGAGKFGEAAEAYHTALRHDPSMAACWEGLARCRAYADPIAMAEQLRAVLRRPDLTGDLLARLNFALGRVLEEAGAFEEAWGAFAAGNALRGRGEVFDRASLTALVDRTIAVFTPAFIAAQRGRADASEMPVFIVGMYRSGTTLVEQIVSQHPAVAAGGELNPWGEQGLDLDAVGEFDVVQAEGAVRRYIDVLRGIGPDAHRVTDKLAINFFRLGAIHALLPGARIIHCRRDPVDTCLSLHTTAFQTRIGFAARQGDLVYYYREYGRLMAHWRAVLPPGRYLELGYERLVSDQAVETRRLIAFLGLEWDERCMAPERNPRAIGTASAWQARQKVYATSAGRWRHYAAWIGELLTLRGEA